MDKTVRAVRVQPVEALRALRDSNSLWHLHRPAAIEERQVRVNVFGCTFLPVAMDAVDRKSSKKALR